MPKEKNFRPGFCTHTHTHTHIYIYIHNVRLMSLKFIHLFFFSTHIEESGRAPKNVFRFNSIQYDAYIYIIIGRGSNYMYVYVICTVQYIYKEDIFFLHRHRFDHESI